MATNDKIFMVAFEQLRLRNKCSRSLISPTCMLDGGTPLEGRARDIMEGMYSVESIKEMNLWYVEDFMARPLIDWTGDDTDCFNNLHTGFGIITYQDILDDPGHEKCGLYYTSLTPEDQKPSDVPRVVYVITSFRFNEMQLFFGFYKSDCPDDLYQEIEEAFTKGKCPPLHYKPHKDECVNFANEPLKHGFVQQIRGVKTCWSMFDLDQENEFKLFDFDMSIYQ